MHRRVLKKAAGFILLLLTMVMVGPLSRAEAWWNEDWQARRKIALNTAGTGGDQGLADFPVLVRLHTGNFDFSRAKRDGSDLRFMAADDRTPLTYHLEKFDPANELALVWVRVPHLASAGAGESIWLYYGNERAAAAGNPGGTYDPGQQLVLHLAETDGTPRDATAYGNHPAQFSAARLQAPIGNGVELRGAGDVIVVPHSPSLDFSKGFTFSAWVRIEQPQGDAFLLSCEDNTKALVVGVTGVRPYLQVTAEGRTVRIPMAGDLQIGTWHHLAATAEPGGRGIVYLDGKETGTGTLSIPLPALSSDLAFGTSLRGDHSFLAEIDEIQVAGAVRPAAWISAAARNQGPADSLVALGPEETGGEDVGSTQAAMAMVAGSISLDGWVIIGILLVFGAVAGLLFVQKVYLFRQMIRENRAFLAEFRIAADPAELADREQEFRFSPIYRIYAKGINDLRRWAHKHAHLEDPKLSPKAFNIFKAVLESGYTEESRRVNGGLVVLTMAISGGPFLGLLGTVWGVMNTFAGMALAGEANIAAIAPGVASALATTVFGLLVAIPALFAYNYLTTQARIIASDMGGFVDHFSSFADSVYGADQ